MGRTIHAADEWRYLVMSRKVTPPVPEPEPELTNDPLDREDPAKIKRRKGYYWI